MTGDKASDMDAAVKKLVRETTPGGSSTDGLVTAHTLRCDQKYRLTDTGSLLRYINRYPPTCYVITIKNKHGI